MNILKQELRQSLKPFIFWSLGIAFLVLAGMVKFTGVSGTDSGAMSDMLAAFPKPVLAIFGMAEANIETLGGFYSILQFYVTIAAACYAVQLGTNAVLRESVDKTYEFLFTKPCSRAHILAMKLLSGLILLTALCALNAVFSFLAPGLYGIKNDISDKMPLFALAVYAVSLLFYALGAFFSSLLRRPERSVQLSYAVLLACYGVSVLFDMDERFEILRFATPFKYFRAAELLDGRLSAGYLAACILVSAVFIFASFRLFDRRDLKAA